MSTLTLTQLPIFKKFIQANEKLLEKKKPIKSQKDVQNYPVWVRLGLFCGRVFIEKNQA